MPCVLVTRPQPDNISTKLKLEAMGHRCLSMPLLTIEPVEAKFPDLEKHQAILITSSNGVRALSRYKINREKKVFVVGRITQEIAYRSGFKNVISADGDVHALEKLIVDECKPQDGKLIHFSGENIAGNLKKKLEDKKFQVEASCLYRAVQTEDWDPKILRAWELGQIESVLLYSKRSAETLANLLHKTSNLPVIDCYCFSKQAFEPLKEFEWREIFFPPQLNEESMLSIIKN